jgi:hypothetical protein
MCLCNNIGQGNGKIEMKNRAEASIYGRKDGLNREETSQW